MKHRYRKADYWAKTVEIPLSELPPPPSAASLLCDLLERATQWAPEVGEDIAEAITIVLASARRKQTERKAA